MKIQFQNLPYQEKAIESVLQVFEGQMIRQSNFTISNNDIQGKLFTETGVANRVTFQQAKMLQNVQQIQIDNGIPVSEDLPTPFPQFNIDMETGTGKTFVYLKSIVQLNAMYGFTKFIIVVPSVAIREGVMKTYHMTKDLFQTILKEKSYHLFQYNSRKLHEIQNFAQNDGIEVMVMNIQAFNSRVEGKQGIRNIIYRDDIESMYGVAPIDLIAETNPVVIIDEPQSVDNQENSQHAIAALKPLVTFRYSATHKNKNYPLLYKLGPVEAYQQELVKQIEVAGIRSNSSGNEAYLRLIEVKSLQSGITATVEMYQKNKQEITRKLIRLKKGKDVYIKSKNVAAYKKVGFVQDLSAEPGNEYIEFSGEPSIVRLSDSIQMELQVKRGQIRKTIEEHLDRELKLNPKGIKVLSLFFIDRVEKYRQYDKEGNALLGEYAKIFEEEYRDLIHREKYKVLRDVSVAAEDVHDGYFATDKSGKKIKNTGGASQDDETAYQIIMKDKEDLLTFYDEAKGKTKRANKLRFIFSHSALREGWDNPNVFQICTLVETNNAIRKRQQIGRGLRIAVNQEGKRIPGFDVNTLTVMANESYEEFATGLQKEYEEDGMAFGVFEKDIFSTIIRSIDEHTGIKEVLGKKESEKIIAYLKDQKYLDKHLKGTESLAHALKDETLMIPPEVVEMDEPMHEQFLAIVQEEFDSHKIEIKNRGDRVEVKIQKEALAEPFLELWNRIKYKTTYSIDFDTEQFIAATAEKLNEDISVRIEQLEYAKGLLENKASGIAVAQERFSHFATSENEYKVAPDILSYLQNETDLTRHTLIRILKESNTLSDFKRNPQLYMMQVAEIINRSKRLMMVDGIKYEKLENESYDQQLFLEDELASYKENVLESVNNRTIYDHIIYDSDVEKAFAEECEKDEDVLFYIKLPSWFKIKTPLGPYNPDWALLKEHNGEEKLYFVIETKGSTFTDDLRPIESAKIRCGTKHFEAIDTGVVFKKAVEYQGV